MSSNEEFALEDWGNSKLEPFELDEEVGAKLKELFRPVAEYLKDMGIPYAFMSQTALYSDGGCFLRSTSHIPNLGRTGNEIIAASVLMNNGLVPSIEILDYVALAANARRHNDVEGAGNVAPHPTIQ